MSNSNFTDNIYFTSNVLNHVGYVKINAVVLNRNKSPSMHNNLTLRDVKELRSS